MSLITPKTSFSNFYDTARYLLAWRVSVCFSSVFILLIGIYGFESGEETIAVSLALCASGGSLVYLIFNDNYKPIFWVYAIAGTIVTHFAINTVMDFTHYVDFLWMIASVLLAFVGLGRKEGVVSIIVNSAGIAYFFWCSLNQHIEIIEPRSNVMLIGDFIEVCLAMFCIAYLLHQYILFNDYLREEIEKTNDKLEKQNEENVVLLKEVHHRVKNNLQIITSLLRLQKHELGSDEEEHMFDEAINRIMTMSIIHQKLYQEGSLSKIHVPTYLEELTGEIKSIYGAGKNIEIEVLSSLDEIGLKTIVPFGLLINELVSNSFKHAFKGKKEGKIVIEINHKLANTFLMKYEDFGVWHDDDNSLKFGVELIHTLTEQLDGTINRQGTSYVFKLSDLDNKD